jgi:PIN domain nuclease of toxin-antitoxin system
MTAFVLDASAILTVLNQEDGLETVVSLLEKAKEGQARVYLSFMALMELESCFFARSAQKQPVISWPW